MNHSQNDKYALQKVEIRNNMSLDEAKKHYKSITKKNPRKIRETTNFFQFRFLPPTKFEPKSFRTKVINDDIHLIYGKLKDTHHKLEGGGLFDYFTKAYDYVKNKVSDAFSYIKDAVSINDYSDSTKNNLSQYGDYPIIGIQLRRVPIAFAIDLALQGISAGEWERLKDKYGFDKFYHLSMVVTLKGATEIILNKGRRVRQNKQLAIEKLEVVSVNENITIGDGMETQDVIIPKNKVFNINDMFQKARDKVGDTKFFSYSALGQNNCQDFIALLLDVEGLYNEEEKLFVYQDISQLAQELPDTAKAISQGITHIGALANKYLGIGGSKVSLDDLYRDSISGGAKDDIVIPKKEFVKEHTHLIGLLNKSDNPELKKEAAIQAKELELKGGGATHRENILKRYKLKDRSYNMEELSKISGVPLSILQEVYNRGIGAYKTNPQSVRLKGSFVKNVDAPLSKKLSKEQWGYARVYSFLDGNPSHDNDLRKNKTGSGEYESESDDDTSDDEYEGGNKAAGFIKAMMARDRATPEEREEYADKNRSKFRKLDAVGFDVKKLSKVTHNLMNTKRQLTKDEAIKEFYDYIIANAPQHQPLSQGGINYNKTYDVAGMFGRWKKSQGVEIREARRAKREAPQPEPDDSFIPSSFFELPEEPKKPISNNKVEVVPVGEEKKEEKKQEKKPEDTKKVVVGKFEDPKTQFQNEINNLVDFAVKYIHFNDLIADVLKPENNPYQHSSTISVSDVCAMYYFIVQYKIPILDLKENVKFHIDNNVYKKKSFRSYAERDEYMKQVELKTVNLYNDFGDILDFATTTKDGKEVINSKVNEIKKNLDKGEKQIIMYCGIGGRGTGHANFILIRAVDKKIYIIDPHGTQEHPKLKSSYTKQEAVFKMVAKLLGDYKLVSSGESCPYIKGDVKSGFQAIENLAGKNMGMCGWWVNFLIELCCLKPDTPFETIYNEASQIMTDTPIKLFNAVMKYQYNLQQIIFQIAKKEKINVKKANKESIFDFYKDLSIILSKRIEELLKKRKEILGYAKLDQEGGSRASGYIQGLLGNKFGIPLDFDKLKKTASKSLLERLLLQHSGQFQGNKGKLINYMLATQTADKRGLYNIEKAKKDYENKDNKIHYKKLLNAVDETINKDHQYEKENIEERSKNYEEYSKGKRISKEQKETYLREAAYSKRELKDYDSKIERAKEVLERLNNLEDKQITPLELNTMLNYVFKSGMDALKKKEKEEFTPTEQKELFDLQQKYKRSKSEKNKAKLLEEIEPLEKKKQRLN